jgi:hypothetical protein
MISVLWQYVNYYYLKANVSDTAKNEMKYKGNYLNYTRTLVWYSKSHLMQNIYIYISLNLSTFI